MMKFLRNSPKRVMIWPKLHIPIPFMDLKHTYMIPNIHLWSQKYIFSDQTSPKVVINMDSCVHFWTWIIHKWSITTIIRLHPIYSNYVPFRNQLRSGGILSGSSDLAPRAYRLRTTPESALFSDFLHVLRKSRLLWEGVARQFVISQSTESSELAYYRTRVHG